jgi:hypothetical protein
VVPRTAVGVVAATETAVEPLEVLEALEPFETFTVSAAVVV